MVSRPRAVVGLTGLPVFQFRSPGHLGRDPIQELEGISSLKQRTSYSCGRADGAVDGSGTDGLRTRRKTRWSPLGSTPQPRETGVLPP